MLRRAKPTQPDLDGLFRLRDASGALAAAGIRPSGGAGVAVRPAQADRFVQLFAAITDLVTQWNTPMVTLRAIDQASGQYQWITADGQGLDELLDAVHVLGSGLARRGFGSLLTAAAFAFATAGGEQLFIVYCFDRGTFYPLGRSGDPLHDRPVERSVRIAAASALPPEDDPARRLPATEVPLP